MHLLVFYEDIVHVCHVSRDHVCFCHFAFFITPLIAITFLMFSGFRDATHYSSVDFVSEKDVPMLRGIFIYLPTLSMSERIRHRMV
jgi:hypothetical protein